MNSIALRQQLRQIRKQLTPIQQQNNAEQAFQHFKQLIENHPRFNQPQKIALFLSQDGELNTQLCIDYLWQQNKHKVFLPVLETQPQWHMAFAEYSASSTMKSNRFDIEEPDTPHHQHFDGETMDWVFMPLVGFDVNGNRLGMGGGYYDRTFAFKAETEVENSTQLTGWAHACQQTDLLSKEPWDIPLDSVITEKGFQQFNQQ